MFLKKENNEVFFLHIPRTGGRFINSVFYSNGFKIPEFRGWEIVNGQEIGHMDFEGSKKYFSNFQAKKSFSVFRHPVDKFISSCKFFWNYNFNFFEFEDYESFVYVMEQKPFKIAPFNCNFDIEFRGLRNNFNNWFKPQHEYFGRGTKVFKYEWGLNDNFVKWINHTFCLNLVDLNNTNYEKLEYDEYNVKPKFSNKILDNIARYYETDLVLYDCLKTPPFI